MSRTKSQGAAADNPVRSIVRTARRLDVGLIVLRTFGQRGMGAFREG